MEKAVFLPNRPGLEVWTAGEKIKEQKPPRPASSHAWLFLCFVLFQYKSKGTGIKPQHWPKQNEGNWVGSQEKQTSTEDPLQHVRIKEKEKASKLPAHLPCTSWILSTRPQQRAVQIVLLSKLPQESSLVPLYTVGSSPFYWADRILSIYGTNLSNSFHMTVPKHYEDWFSHIQQIFAVYVLWQHISTPTKSSLW